MGCILPAWDTCSTEHKVWSDEYGMIMYGFLNILLSIFEPWVLSLKTFYNANQGNLPFGLTADLTYADHGSRAFLIEGVKTSSRCTVMLCCSLSAGKLPPYIVFCGSSN
jgi:hypothetical protein